MDERSLKRDTHSTSAQSRDELLLLDKMYRKRSSLIKPDSDVLITGNA
jgi:hypothetical protein